MKSDIGQAEAALYAADDFDSFFASAASDRLMAQIQTRIARADVVSFDVFDTVLLRDGKSELGRFADFAARFCERLAGIPTSRPVTQRAALTARIFSASTAYQLSEPVQGTTEGRLDDIARNMMHSLRLPPDTAELWIDCELETDSEQLSASDFARRIIEHAKAAGKRVILVSDMYLSEAQIRSLLARGGVDLGLVDRVYSTADITVNKRSGTVFAHIAKELGAKPGRILHLGDSRVSDYQRPGEAGWMAQYLPVPRRMLRARMEHHHATCEAFFGQRDFPLPMAVPSV